MTKSEQIQQELKENSRGKITSIQIRVISMLSDTISKFEEAQNKMGYPDYKMTEKEAEAYIEELSELVDNDYDPNDPESWDCSEEEYIDRFSDLANKAHEISEGER